MLRFSLSILLCAGFVCFLSAQRNLLVHWKYHDGQVDSSTLLVLPKRIQSTHGLYLRDLKQGTSARGINKVDLDLKEVAWLVHAGDTLVHAIDYLGYNYPAQKIYDGRIELYRTIGDDYFDYFIVYRGEVYHLKRNSARETGRELEVDDCACYRPPTYIYSDYAVIELARQVDVCLSDNEEKIRSYQHERRFRAGMAVNVWQVAAGQSNNDYSVFFAGEYAYRLPRLSLVLAYAPLRGMPGFFTELQVRSLNMRLTDVKTWPSGIHYEEDLLVDNLYLYPGFGFRFTHNRFIEPHIGMGFTMAIPLRFYRVVEFPDRNQTLSSEPIRQEVNQAQGFSMGAYLAGGLRLNFHPRVSLAVNLRTEHLNQHFKHWQESLIASDLFDTRRKHLVPQINHLLQIHATYHW